MNKQAKLYTHGMQPVFRVGEKGKWERVKDKTVHCVSNTREPEYPFPLAACLILHIMYYLFHQNTLFVAHFEISQNIIR